MPCCNTSPYERLQRVLCHPCSYTANAIKQRTELYSGVSCDCSYSAANDTRPIQSTITQLAPRWSVSQRPEALRRIPDITATPGRCTGQHRRPIIIRYISVRRCVPVMDPCQTAQQIEDHASPAGQLLPCVDCWQVMTRCQQYRPGAPAEMSASSPVQG